MTITEDDLIEMFGLEWEIMWSILKMRQITTKKTIGV